MHTMLTACLRLPSRASVTSNTPAVDVVPAAGTARGGPAAAVQIDPGCRASGRPEAACGLRAMPAASNRPSGLRLPTRAQRGADGACGGKGDKEADDGKDHFIRRSGHGRLMQAQGLQV